jgi:hypothetical protein
MLDNQGREQQKKKKEEKGTLLLNRSFVDRMCWTKDGGTIETIRISSKKQPFGSDTSFTRCLKNTCVQHVQLFLFFK